MIKGNLRVENVRIGFRNFTGKGSKYNRDGCRNFALFLEEDQARDLQAEGWNVKIKEDIDYDRVSCHLSVECKFGCFKDPNIFLIMNGKKQRIMEDTVSTLDYIDIDYCDVVVRPYNYEVNGRTGVKAYLDTLYVIAKEDAFASKYGNYDCDDEPVDDGDVPF